MEGYRFHSDGALFYVTFTIVNWLPVLVSEAACKIVTESLMPLALATIPTFPGTRPGASNPPALCRRFLAGG
jgi:hypothetical protein